MHRRAESDASSLVDPDHARRKDASPANVKSVLVLLCPRLFLSFNPEDCSTQAFILREITFSALLRVGVNHNTGDGWSSNVCAQMFIQDSVFDDCELMTATARFMLVVIAAR